MSSIVISGTPACQGKLVSLTTKPSVQFGAYCCSILCTRKYEYQCAGNFYMVDFWSIGKF